MSETHKEFLDSVEETKRELEKLNNFLNTKKSDMDMPSGFEDLFNGRMGNG